jgi:two-component system chemotaxis response regulator CheB
VVGVAASAGGVEALRQFAAALPADLPAAILVVLHIAPTGPTLLPQILGRAGRLPARHPQDGEPLAPGVILVAPPGQHLTVADGHVRLLSHPREHGHRPSADMLLRSAAEASGPACSGVVLSGTMDDGAAGLAAVRRAGGLALVQDPSDALFPGMPRAAIAAADPQFTGTVPVLAGHLCRWLGELDRAAAVTTGTVSGGQPAAVTGADGSDPEPSGPPGTRGAPGSGPEPGERRAPGRN